MKLKATLYIQKTIWIEHEVEIEVPNAQSTDDSSQIIDVIEDTFNAWADNQEDHNDPAVSYELDDYGWEELDENSSKG